MAVTHTEVYRRFKGELARHPFRWIPLFTSEFFAAAKSRLALLLLYGPVAIACIVATVLVYLGYQAEGLTRGGEDMGSMGFAATVALATTRQLLAVREIVVQFFGTMTVFSLLSATWYGAGLVCEDRRVNANLLYFSRPLNRLDYFLGKFATLFTFGSFSMLAPGLVICVMAVLFSPDYSFLTEQGDVIVFAILYAVLWITAVASVVLAISSLAPKKLFAMVGVFGFFALSTLGVEIANEIGDVPVVELLSLVHNLDVVSRWMMKEPGTAVPTEVWTSLLSIGATVAVALLVLARRLRKMELAA